MSRSFRALFIASVACLIATVVLRPLWFDEILGHWMSTLAWPDEARAATRAGIDLQPPGWYWLVSVSEALTGTTRGPRVLALIGVVGAALLVGRLARERWGAEYGHLATAALLLSAGHNYAFEGRPYGLLLGCSALAFFAWCRVVEERRRALWLTVLGVSLLLAVQLHYYAVLLWIPLGVGELVRTRVRGRIDWPLLAVVAAPLPLIFVFLSDAQAASKLMRLAPFSSPSVKALGGQYKSLLATLWSALVALLLLLVCRDGPARCRDAVLQLARDPRLAAIAAYLLMPLASMLLSVAGSAGLSHHRYALAFTVGASLTIAGLLHALGLRAETLRRVAGLAAAAMLFVCGGDVLRAWRTASKLDPNIVLNAPEGLPQVHPSGTDGLELWQVADEATRSHMFLAADPEVVAASGWTATSDVNLAGSRGFFPFPVIRWSELNALNTDFVLVQRERGRTWLLEKVLRSGARIEPLTAQLGWEAWRVHMPERERPHPNELLDTSR